MKYLDMLMIIFYNEKDCLDKIISELQVSLKKYKLNLNSHKEKIYEKPIITEISIAKKEISALFNKKIKYKVIEKTDSEAGEIECEKKISIYINSNDLIQKFKSILKQTNVNYKDILNWALSIIESLCKKLVKDFKKYRDSYEGKKRRSFEKEFVKSCNSILEFVFFIYSVEPRVNTSIKLCRILDLYIRFFRKDVCGKKYQHQVYKLIFDNTCFILQKNKTDKYCQVETLYLLVILAELGKGYWLDQHVLASYVGAEQLESMNSFTFKALPNHFVITVMLFYMKDKKIYTELKKALLDSIDEKFSKQSSILFKHTELLLIFLDLIVCPYLEENEKNKLFCHYEIDDQTDKKVFMNSSKYWFTKWDNFNMAKELDSKSSFEVY